MHLRTLGSRAAVLLGLLLVGCAGDMPSTSTDASDHKPDDPGSEGLMVVEGRIATVMESWPPQLTVETHDGRYHVGLLPETVILLQGEQVRDGELAPGLQIRITGQYSGPNAMVAQRIEILATGK
jgi:hypothetical protein